MSEERHDENDEHARTEVTVSIRDATGRAVSAEADVSFVTGPLPAGMYEAVLHLVVGRRGRRLTEHAHRFSFTVP